MVYLEMILRSVGKRGVSLGRGKLIKGGLLLWGLVLGFTGFGRDCVKCVLELLYKRELVIFLLNFIFFWLRVVFGSVKFYFFCYLAFLDLLDEDLVYF